MTQTDAVAAAVSPLKNDNFKLGIFCLNESGGAMMTKAPDQVVPTWDQSVRVAQAAREAGWEFLLPSQTLARRGYSWVARLRRHERALFEMYTCIRGVVL
jgi:hypothetical protein